MLQGMQWFTSRPWRQLLFADAAKFALKSGGFRHFRGLPLFPRPIDEGALSSDPVLPTFEELRMCHRGCIKKIEEHLEPSQLPALSANASSFWSVGLS